MILLIDTSGAAMRVGLGDESRGLLDVIEVMSTPEDRGVHDAHLAEQCRVLLAERDVALDQVKRIGIIIGPGSFTGLRIGLAFAKGLAFTTGAEIVPLTLHEVMASQLAGKKIDGILTMGYQRGLVYLAEHSTPKIVELMKLDELSIEENYAGLAELAPIMLATFGEGKFTSMNLELSVMLKCVLHAESAANIDELEPYYVTDFTPVLSGK